MDWIRRNWPDLIIGIALLAVIAGIIATLLSGGSFFPFSNTGPSSGTQPSVSTPQTGQASSTTTTAAPTVTVPDTTADTAAVPSNEAPPPGPPVTSDETVAVDTAETATSTVTVVSPEVPEVASEPTTESVESVTPLAPGTTEANQAGTGDPLIEAPTSTQPVLESGESTALFPESPYRISVGSYRDASNAERRAESFRSAGYPVFIGQQDDLSIVLVGPYNDRSQAEAAVASIQRDGLEAAPLLFELADDSSESASVVEAATTAVAATAEAITNTVESVPAQAATTAVAALQGRYLQAGAYDSSEGARPQRERLEGFGFDVAEVREGSFVKLLVGPFSEEALSSAQTRLNEQGVEHFVRSF